LSNLNVICQKDWQGDRTFAQRRRQRWLSYTAKANRWLGRWTNGTLGENGL